MEIRTTLESQKRLYEAAYDEGRRAAIDELLAALYDVDGRLSVRPEPIAHLTGLLRVMQDYRARYPQPAAADREDGGHV